MKKNILTLALACLFSLTVSISSNAASQCVGLSSSACASKSTQCTWRKASVNKNGNKIKAHCRALPGKAKNSKPSLKKTKAPNSNSSSKSKTTKQKTKSTKKKATSSNAKTTKSKAETTPKKKTKAKKKS